MAETTTTETPPRAELPPDRFLNRELSWLDFNARVLELAEDDGQPLLERMKFLAIFASSSPGRKRGPAEPSITNRKLLRHERR